MKVKVETSQLEGRSQLLVLEEEVLDGENIPQR